VDKRKGINTNRDCRQGRKRCDRENEARVREFVGSTFYQNISKHLPDYMASHPRRH
jgi:hypothetical protein